MPVTEDFAWECYDEKLTDKLNALITECERECGPVAGGYCASVAKLILEWANPMYERLNETSDE